MRLLLDEMWSAEIAVQLRRRGHDVIAATEPGPATRYTGVPDPVVFERAPTERRAIVTDDVADYEAARLAWKAAGQPHYGVIYPISHAFDRHRGGRVIGPMVQALDRFLSDHPGAEPFNAAHYLRPPGPDA